MSKEGREYMYRMSELPRPEQYGSRENFLHEVKREFTRPGSSIAFSGKSRLMSMLGLSHDEADQIIETSFHYPLHVNFKQPPLFNPITCLRPRELIQVDLFFMLSYGDVEDLSQYNDGVKYVFCAIDCFTRLAWVAPLRDKKTSSVVTCLDALLDRQAASEAGVMSATSGSVLASDKGKEFQSKTVALWCQKHGIKQIFSRTRRKCSIVERFQQSLQNLIYRYMTEYETNRYIDVLGLLLHTYNSRKHRGIHFFSPIEAESSENWKLLRQGQLEKRRLIREKFLARQPRQSLKAYQPGDIVRIRPEFHRKARSYHAQFSLELYVITEIINDSRYPIPMIKVKRLDDNLPLDSVLYMDEMQRVSGDEYRIEKVLRRKRSKDGTEMLLVRWQHFSKDHDSWIQADRVTRVF